MYPSQELQDIERQHGAEEIPLQVRNGQTIHNGDSSAEHEKRLRIRRLFEKYDRNRNNYLDLKEIKRLIKDHACEDIPKGAVKEILRTADTNNDGKLSFDEFYIMCTEREWLVRSYAVKYCKLVVPSPHRGVDETDGAYENSMTFCPPPLTMVIFSIIEIIFFLIDVIYLDELQYGNAKVVGKTTNGPAAKLFIYNPFKREEAWRFVTYMFVHVGIMHLMMNLIGKILR